MVGVVVTESWDRCGTLVVSKLFGVSSSVLNRDIVWGTQDTSLIHIGINDLIVFHRFDLFFDLVNFVLKTSHPRSLDIKIYKGPTNVTRRLYFLVTKSRNSYLRHRSSQYELSRATPFINTVRLMCNP